MKKRIIILIAAFLLMAVIATAQESNKVYVLALNYKKQAIFESLSFININLSEGNPFPDNSGNDYRLDLTSESQLLKTINFSVPFGSVILNGMISNGAKGTPDDLNFTIKVPYISEAKTINIYDKSNNKVLNVPLNYSYESAPEIQIDGELEIIHADDFEHPENSKFFFYLRTSTHRYELESTQSLPVVMSGTPARVKGKVAGSRILVQSFEILGQNNENASNGANNVNQTQNKGNAQINIPQKSNLTWAYIFVPLIFVICFLSYIEIKRMKEHKLLLKQQQNQSNLALRNYVNLQLRKGFSKEQIRNALIKNNYSFQEIEEVFSGIR